jgi:predicted amidohydrolase
MSDPGTLAVAGLQMAVTSDVAANSARIAAGIAWAAEEGADILLTPEGSLSGYRPDADREDVRSELAVVLATAREARLGLALGTCLREADGACYNQIRFYDRAGAFLGFHTKTLRCGSPQDPPRGEIEHYAVRPLRTFRFGGITVGGLICNDLWANPACTPMPDPHLARQLASLGARVVFHAVNGGRDGSDWSRMVWGFHESNLRMRARALRLWIVTVDSAHPVDLPCSAPSGVVGPDGEWVCRTPPQGEQRFVCRIELPDLEQDC